MKFSGYWFYMNTNILGDFQICISVPLRDISCFEKTETEGLFPYVKENISCELVNFCSFSKGRETIVLEFSICYA